MKRKIYKQLLKWKENKDRKPLMLLGTRKWVTILVIISYKLLYITYKEIRR